MKCLVICEKPSVAADVARVLGAGKAGEGFFESAEWVVGHALGHLVEHVDPEAYDPRYRRWRFEDLPILPDQFRYEARDARAGKQLALLHRTIRRSDVNAIVNACDAGREGELIFKLILETSGARKPVERAWFSSMTPKAIRDAFAHLRPDADMRPLESAARARAEADWLVGMNASRAATLKMGSYRAALSLGRVQTPTLALIVRRELEIRDFKPEPYWQVRARFATSAAATYDGWWHRGARDRLDRAEEAERIAASARGAPAVVASVERNTRTERPPLLYDLTTLQREANARFGFTARRTLAAAQACYDAHKVLTYPRTDSRFLTSDMVPALRAIAAEIGRAAPEYAVPAAYVTSLERLPLGRVVNDGRVSDHHAIIPTDDAHDLARLGPDERRIYDLVARRFLAAFHPDAKWDETVVQTEARGESFRSRGRVLVQAGWRAAYGAASGEVQGPEAEKREGDLRESAATGKGAKRDHHEEDEPDQALPPLSEGEAVSCLAAEVLAKLTKPPVRYSEGSLLRAMETAGKLVDDEEVADAMKERGLGTPATRAAIIERLLEKEYIGRERRALHATLKGVELITALGDQAIASPAMTGEWELKLNHIETHGGDRDAFMGEIRDYTRAMVAWFAGQGRLRPQRDELGDCPTPGCGGRVVERPKSFGCTSWKSKAAPGCGLVIWKRARGRRPVTAGMVRESLAAGAPPPGPAGDATRASSLPSREPIADCPTPGCGGRIRPNRAGWGCDSWKSRREPGCGFVIWRRSRELGRDLTVEDAIEQVRLASAGLVPATGLKTPSKPRRPDLKVRRKVSAGRAPGHRRAASRNTLRRRGPRSRRS